MTPSKLKTSVPEGANPLIANVFSEPQLDSELRRHVDMSICVLVVIISHGTCISNHQLLHLKCIQFKLQNIGQF